MNKTSTRAHDRPANRDNPAGVRLAHACLAWSLAALLAGCASKPLQPWTDDVPAHVLVPIAAANVTDMRARFREIFCAVLEERGEQWPDYRPCEQALTRLSDEPEGQGQPVNLGHGHSDLVALIVPGIGWECIEEWVNLDNSIANLLGEFRFSAQMVKVDGLSGSTHNARQVRDWVMSLPPDLAQRPIMLIGYSKGAPDILEALVLYPELAERVVAVVSAAGAVGGSPLANGATQSQLNLMRYFPGAECSAGDGQGVASLRPDVRRRWLAENPLPKGIAYYSLVTYPQPERISSALQVTYRKLSEVDARNDSQVLYYDQIIPGSRLIGFINADHWALAVPIARSHSFLGNTFVDQNDYPREAMVEAILRMVEEDLASDAVD